MDDGDGRLAGVAAYYRHATRAYADYGAGTEGWHYPLWAPGVETHAEALLESNRRLVDDVGLGPDAQVLDVGCGVGGFSVWAASTFGCRVTGITVVEAHVDRARARARDHGVLDRCTFLAMDMNALDLPGERFDLVVNQDTLVHADPVVAYLERARAVLRPGGHWRATTYCRAEDRMTPEARALHDAACEAWWMTPLPTRAELERAVREAGLGEEGLDDVTALTARGAADIAAWSRRMRADLDGVAPALRVIDPDFVDALERHVAGGQALSEGFVRGLLRLVVARGRRDGAEAPSARRWTPTA